MLYQEMLYQEMLFTFETALLPSTPWKNGGGLTREIVCRPQVGDTQDFLWRVSIATIERDGPFSAFPGVDRSIMLLDGDGVCLEDQEGRRHRLDRPLVPFNFAGEQAMACTLLGGASTDFNVMTRRGALNAEVIVLREAASLPPRKRGLLLALGGVWHLDDTLRLPAGTGVWWDDTLVGGRITTDGDTAAALVWVSLEDTST